MQTIKLPIIISKDPIEYSKLNTKQIAKERELTRLSEIINKYLKFYQVVKINR